MDTIQTGAFLAALRKSKGMTQQEVGDRLNVSNKTISKWESGGGFPEITLLPDLAKLYGVTVDEVLAGASTVKGIPTDIQVEYEQKQAIVSKNGIKNINYTWGYVLSLICFIFSIIFRFTPFDGVIASVFLTIGGVTLFAIGIIKYINEHVIK